MMSVLEYANDVNKTVTEILKKCEELNILVYTEDDTLTEDNITSLDNADYDDIEEIVDEIIETKKIKVNDSISTQKLKKKSETTQSKKSFAIRKKEMYKNKEKLMTNATTSNVVLYKKNMTVGELASSLNINSSELVKKLFSLGIMATINNAISFENAEILVLDYDKELKKEETADVTNFEQYEIIDNEEDLIKRPPVVTIMGHVDHGKTTLLDNIRRTHIVDLEAGGITQAISAYQVKVKDDHITFIDTPGHAAFTEMRARGASITDIIVIIVAADDGVMPQTEEVIDHAKAANVPIIVAINKIDKPTANIERVMTQLVEHGLTPEAWGGNVLVSEISAKDGTGVESLLESILLVAEMTDYKANPNRYAVGTVIESRLDKHLGPIVTILVQNGTLRIGDPIVVGSTYGKIRTLKNDKMEDIAETLLSQPVEITGINDVPLAGDKFMAFESERAARSIGEERKNKARLRDNVPKEAVTLEDLFSKIKEGIKEINVIVKADVNGSSEAVKNSLEKLSVEDIKINVIRSSVGAIKESDIVLAQASNAIIICFNVRPTNNIRDYAKEHSVEIRLYDIIYKVVEDMEAAMKGMLDPIYEEQITGSAEVRKLFKFSKVGVIAGSYVLDGIIKRTSKARIIRDGIVLYDGLIGSIQREKDTVKEVKKGLECGFTIEKFNDLKEGDIIEAYEIVEMKR